MSVVAGKVYEDKIVVAADSIVVRSWESKRTGFSKLKSVNGMLIGGTGNCDEISLMFQFAKTHKPGAATERDVLTYMVEFSKWKKEYIDSGVENSYMIAYGGHLFSALRLFVDEVKDYDAIGAGEDFANAAMYLGHTPQEAVKVAADLSCFVAEPIVSYEMNRESV